MTLLGSLKSFWGSARCQENDSCAGSSASALPSTTFFRSTQDAYTGQVTDQSKWRRRCRRHSHHHGSRHGYRSALSLRTRLGRYVAPNLNPGIYTRCELSSWDSRRSERQNVNLDVGGDVRVDATLQPGSQSQTVTVTESLPVVDTTNAQTGGVLSAQLLTSLPLSGRNYRWQQDLVPGVLFTPGHGTAALNVNGVADGHAGNNYLDGVYAQTYESAEISFGGAGEAGDATILPLDAIQDVNVVTNPQAEYGWVPGVTASVGLKSGTNSIHGDAYAFGRTTALDAKNPFASARYPLQFEQFGATIGGPIKKDKLFYFAAFEGYLENLTTVVSETPPTLADTGNVGLSIPDAIAAINTYDAGPSRREQPRRPPESPQPQLGGLQREQPRRQFQSCRHGR